MPYVVSITDAQKLFAEYTFVKALTQSEQKAAFHVKTAQGADLCLKLIAPNYSIDRLEREIIALQTVSHPNVVRLVEYTFSSKTGQHRHYLVEEFIEGTDLDAHLVAGQSWQRTRIADFFAPLCDGLAEFQRHGIVHRDLKPSNIRVRADGSPVIIDFGLARLLNMTDLTRTAEGAAIGTPLYFAPEQFSGTKYDIDHRTDLFAVGVLIYQALIGQHPFATRGLTYDQLGNIVCGKNDCLGLPAFKALPNEWRLVVSRLLEKDRSRRPQGASQVASLLRKFRGV